MSTLTIDGSNLEGGGQILRNTVALSALLRKPVIIENIRAKRKQAGLKKQHLTGIQLAASITDAELAGDAVKSTRISFKPNSVFPTAKSWTADIETAGSTALLLQISLPIILFSSPHQDPPIHLTLRGGTNADLAPQIDYTEHILLPFIAKHFGVKTRLNVHRRGYFPVGRGEVHVSIHPSSEPLTPLQLTQRGRVTRVHGYAHVAGYSLSAAEDMRKGAMTRLIKGGVDASLIDIQSKTISNNEAVGKGGGITLVAETEHGGLIGGSALSSPKKSGFQVGEKAAYELLDNLQHGGCVDEYLQDQIIIFMALAKGRSSVLTGPVSLHTRTAIWVAEQVTDAKFDVEENGTTVLISCEGVGYSLT